MAAAIESGTKVETSPPSRAIFRRLPTGSASLIGSILPSAHKYGLVLHVKTTLEIPDPLFRRAKATAARQGRTMKDFVNEALAEKLSSGALGGKEPGWRAVLGTLSPEAKKAAVKIDGTIYAANFSKVDPGMWE